MKVFKNMSPQQIARYIKRFHHGSFMVEALGRFEFSGGQLALTSLTSPQAQGLVRQIRVALRQLRYPSPMAYQSEP